VNGPKAGRWAPDDIGDLTGTVALVTGATSGICHETAVELAAHGAHVVLACRDRVKGLQAADHVVGNAAGASVELLVVDLASQSSVHEAARRFTDEHGRLDVLVNNAGISLLVPAERTPTESWQRVIDVNLTGPFLLCRELGPLMLADRSGSIVNVASIAGLRGVSHRVAYNASKHGLIGLTSTLAAEWGGRGVRVNAVCPGWIKTEMDAEDQASGAYSDADIANQVPLARFAAPEDVARAVAFLADPARSGFINGVALPVDGGWAADASWTSLRLKTRGPALEPE
jgi:NAD(P)-dependent dehydrogenase (short-subunit alcohol dehydrogenase family)